MVETQLRRKEEPAVETEKVQEKVKFAVQTSSVAAFNISNNALSALEKCLERKGVDFDNSCIKKLLTA